ncbi:MAG: MFS transporter [Chthoniobacteraceae bacterium]|nr:MFS transporter [Chthoniobacteraceae bacterium]
MASNQSAPQKSSRIPNKSLFSWAIGNFGQSLLTNAWTALLMPVFNTGFGLSAVLISWARTIPAFLDAFLDPCLGYLSDITRSRWGRRRPYILAGSIVTSILLVGVWWVGRDWSDHAKFAFLLTICTLNGIACSLFMLPLNALGYELTDDYHERTRMNAVVIFFTVIPFMIANWIYWLALRPVFGGEINGVRWISIPLAIVVALCGIVPVLFCRERFSRQTAKKNLGLWASIRTTLTNRPFRRLVFIRVFMTLGTTVFGGLVFYINTYYICGGDKSLAMKITGVGGTLYALVALAQLPFATPISRRMGKTKGLRLGLGILLGTSLLQPLVQNPHYPYLQIVTTVLCAPAFTLALIFIGSFMPDICDLDEIETGLRREGVYGAVISFIGKIEGSLCVLIVGYLVSFSGFNQALAQQAPAVLLKLRLYAYAPNFLFTFLALLFAWRFPINEEMMRNAHLVLDARHAAADRENSGVAAAENRPADI